MVIMVPVQKIALVYHFALVLQHAAHALKVGLVEVCWFISKRLTVCYSPSLVKWQRPCYKGSRGCSPVVVHGETPPIRLVVIGLNFPVIAIGFVMQDSDLSQLQMKIEKLLAVHESLRSQNRAMREAEAQWQAERAQLVQQNEIARRKVNEMITRLQTLERNSG